MIEVHPSENGRILTVEMTGKLTTEDYERFLPEMERLIASRRSVRILLHMRDFHGWTAGALWQDLTFGLKHSGQIERLAMVGDRQWEAVMAAFCKPFTSATVRYFDQTDGDAARAWIEQAADEHASMQ